jgi:phage shock protein A
MGIISRFINVVRAYSNSFLDKAEDPEKMLQQMLSDLEGQKRQAKQQMTEALALQKRLERDTEKNIRKQKNGSRRRF